MTRPSLNPVLFCNCRHSDDQNPDTSPQSSDNHPMRNGYWEGSSALRSGRDYSPQTIRCNSLRTAYLCRHPSPRFRQRPHYRRRRLADRVFHILRPLRHPPLRCRRTRAFFHSAEPAPYRSCQRPWRPYARSPEAAPNAPSYFFHLSLCWPETGIAASAVFPRLRPLCPPFHFLLPLQAYRVLT